jgi:small subunit ribosomal protein S3Ae
MAKKQINKSSRISVVKKRWYGLEAPKVFDNIPFGETPAADEKMLVGRHVKSSLNAFMRGGKRQNVEVTFRVTEVKAGKCVTEFLKSEILQPYVKRLVKRAKKRFDNSFLVKTKDDVDVRLKPILLVKDTVQKGIGTALRKITEEYYVNVAKELTFNELVNKVLLGETSKELKSKLKQTYPVSIVEMRILQRVQLKK